MSTFKVELARDAQAPQIARHLVGEWFAVALYEEELQTAKLLVSELVTNAVRHGQGRLRVRGDLDEDRLLVEVTDEGHGLERSIRERRTDAIGGWGFKILDATASRWGVHDGTTNVWFEIERRGPRLGKAKNQTGAEG
jgi:anti-sigma regulatory factor (Ser/Thr protein kinase)